MGALGFSDFRNFPLPKEVVRNLEYYRLGIFTVRKAEKPKNSRVLSTRNLQLQVGRRMIFFKSSTVL